MKLKSPRVSNFKYGWIEGVKPYRAVLVSLKQCFSMTSPDVPGCCLLTLSPVEPRISFTNKSQQPRSQDQVSLGRLRHVPIPGPLTEARPGHMPTPGEGPGAPHPNLIDRDGGKGGSPVGNWDATIRKREMDTDLFISFPPSPGKLQLIPACCVTSGKPLPLSGLLVPPLKNRQEAF